MKAYLLDDEHLARERMKSLLQHANVSVEIIGESGIASEAIEQINESKPDVIFLDIHMPGLDGFDVVSMLEKPLPYIIFVTAFDEYAIKAFEVYALDYLTKPVRIDRLNQSLKRISKNANHNLMQQNSLEKVIADQPQKPLHVLTGKIGRSIHVLDISTVLYLEAKNKLIYAHTESNKYRIDGTLDNLEHRLIDGSFVRIHRSYLVNVKYMTELIPWFSGAYEIKLTSGVQLSVSRRRVKDVKTQLGI